MKPVAVSHRTRASDTTRSLEKYYALHAHIYDATRWAFLFGRSAILEVARSAAPAPLRILEVGCGTGRNLIQLARLFPHAQLTGVDLSAAMLNVARRKTACYGPRISLKAQSYHAPLGRTGGYDLVLCSYHVRMDGQLLPLLRENFTPVIDQIRPAYGGVWDYGLFVGRKKD